MLLPWIGTGAVLLFSICTVILVLVTYSDVAELLKCEKSNYPRGSRSISRNQQICYSNAFRDILLVIVYNYEYYDTISLLQRMYRGAFPSIVVCGTDKKNQHRVNISIHIVNGIFGYQCLSKAIEQNPGYKGYFYINDDMIVNFWNLGNLERDKIWQGSFILNGAPMFTESPDDNMITKWVWFNSSFGLKACISAYKEIHRTYPKPLFRTIERNLIHNGGGEIYCSKGWSDVFYIPDTMAQSFMKLSNIFYSKGVFLELAVPTIIRMLDRVENTVKLNGIYLPDYGNADSKAFWTLYNTEVKFVHPFKFLVQNFKEMNNAIFKNWILNHVKKLTVC